MNKRALLIFAAIAGYLAIQIFVSSPVVSETPPPPAKMDASTYIN